ncbi:MAG: hypothetical protein IKQ06_05535 [Bacilli bacterium]|nr:hypothetical protein [Bacilli bacterium]
MKKKIIIILIVLVFLVLSFFGIKRLIWNYKVAHAKKIVELATNQVPVYQSNIRIRSLIKEINGKLTTNPKIKTDKIGKQTIKFNYTTDEGYPVSYEVEIEVIDTTPPKIFQLKSKTVYTGYDGDLAKSLFCGDNYDPNPKCTIEGEYDVNTPGVYDLKFIGEDQSGNKSTNSFSLTIKDKPKSTGGGGNTSYTSFEEVKEKYKAENTKFGIDVSHWQGDINFKKVKEAGVEFVYIRVGRGDGIGKDYVLDDKFERNIKGFNEVGIPVGVYFYSNANSSKDAEREAKWIMKQIKNYKVDLEVVYDWENWGNFQDYDLSFYGLKDSYQKFNKTLKEKGYKGMLYGSKSYLESVWDNPVEVWVAHYTEQTNYMGKINVWQLCDDGKVDGINGYVDLDIRYE